MADFASAPEPRNPAKLALAAAVLIAAAAVAVSLLHPGRDATVAVTEVQTFAPHTTFSAMRATSGSHIIGGVPSAEDDLYVVATVHLQNNLHRPVALFASSASLTTPDDARMDATMIVARDIPRLEESFPALKPMLTHVLPDDAEIGSKQSVDGSVVMLFPGAGEAFWQKKKSAQLTIELAHEQPLSVSLP
jgi:hypothetical protein